MNKLDALKKVIERKKEQNMDNFEKEVGSLVWEIENTSQRLKELKKQLTELTFEEINIPDLSDCIEWDVLLKSIWNGGCGSDLRQYLNCESGC